MPTSAACHIASPLQAGIRCRRGDDSFLDRTSMKPYDQTD